MVRRRNRGITKSLNRAASHGPHYALMRRASSSGMSLRTGIIAILLGILAVIGIHLQVKYMDTKYQAAMDIRRIKDVEQIAATILEYVANASMLEAELSTVLGREVLSPRDPQRVATYAPNVYIYFVADGQMSVIGHLFRPSENSVKYEWQGGGFYSHTLTYASKSEK